MSDQIEPTDSDDELDPATMEAIMIAIASSGVIDPKKMAKALERLAVDKESLKSEVEAEIRSEIEAEYQDMVPEKEILFDGLDAKRRIKIGVGDMEREVKIRWMVSRDGERIAQVIPDLISYIYKSGPKKLIGLSPSQLLVDVLDMFSKPKAREDFKQAVYNELAKWLTCGKDQVITGDWLRDYCQPGQIVNAALETYKVNEVFFIGLWRVLPGQLTGPFATLAGKIMMSLKNLGQLNWDLQALFNGTGQIPAGGIPNGLIPSLQSMGGLPQLLGTWISLNSGDIKKPLETATTGQDTSLGSTAKTPKPKAAKRVTKTATGQRACPKKNGKPSSHGQTKAAPTGHSSSENTPDTSPATHDLGIKEAYAIESGYAGKYPLPYVDYDPEADLITVAEAEARATDAQEYPYG